MTEYSCFGELSLHKNNYSLAWKVWWFGNSDRCIKNIFCSYKTNPLC